MLPPAEYAQTLGRLHAGLRQIDVTTPHFMDRVAATQQDVASRDVTPDLAETDRALLANTLRDLRRLIVNRRAAEQLLHGEPHPWNVLNTKNGPVFMDFERSTRGPVEFDLVRWSRDDQHPSGRQSGVAFLNALREGPPWPALDAV